MALSMDEQRILEEMERKLADDDPLLASRLTSFGRPGLAALMRSRRARIVLSLPRPDRDRRGLAGGLRADAVPDQLCQRALGTPHVVDRQPAQPAAPTHRKAPPPDAAGAPGSGVMIRARAEPGTVPAPPAASSPAGIRRRAGRRSS